MPSSVVAFFILETHFGKIWRQLVTVITTYDVINSMCSFLIHLKCVFFTYFGRKTYRTLPKAAKCLIASNLTTLDNLFLCKFRVFSINFYFSKIQDSGQLGGQPKRSSIFLLPDATKSSTMSSEFKDTSCL